MPSCDLCPSSSSLTRWSSSSSAAFSSSAARAIEVHSSRHCSSSSVGGGFSFTSPFSSSCGGSDSSAASASYSAMRSRSFSCIEIDHSAFHPSACICRMATSCMNICDDASFGTSRSSASAISSCEPSGSASYPPLSA